MESGQRGTGLCNGQLPWPAPPSRAPPIHALQLPSQPPVHPPAPPTPKSPTLCPALGPTHATQPPSQSPALCLLRALLQKREREKEQEDREVARLERIKRRIQVGATIKFRGVAKGCKTERPELARVPELVGQLLAFKRCKQIRGSGGEAAAEQGARVGIECQAWEWMAVAEAAQGRAGQARNCLCGEPCRPWRGIGCSAMQAVVMSERGKDTGFVANAVALLHISCWLSQPCCAAPKQPARPATPMLCLLPLQEEDESRQQQQEGRLAGGGDPGVEVEEI